MRWNAATGAIARCKATSIAYARKRRSAHAWRWTCGVKPKPKAGNKPSPHFIVHGLDKPGGFTTVSIFLASNLLWVSPMRLTIPCYRTRYEENGQVRQNFSLDAKKKITHFHIASIHTVSGHR